MEHLSKHITEAVAHGKARSNRYTKCMYVDTSTTPDELESLAKERGYFRIRQNASLDYMDTYHLGRIYIESINASRNDRSMLKCNWWTGHETYIFMDFVSEYGYALKFNGDKLDDLLKFKFVDGDAYEVLEQFFKQGFNKQIAEINKWFEDCAKKWKS